MGIMFRRFSVRRPAGMADAHRSRQRFSFKIFNPAFYFINLDAVIIYTGDSGRIIPAVFKAL